MLRLFSFIFWSNMSNKRKKIHGRGSVKWDFADNNNFYQDKQDLAPEFSFFIGTKWEFVVCPHCKRTSSAAGTNIHKW